MVFPSKFCGAAWMDTRWIESGSKWDGLRPKPARCPVCHIRRSRREQQDSLPGGPTPGQPMPATVEPLARPRYQPGKPRLLWMSYTGIHKAVVVQQDAQTQDARV